MNGETKAETNGKSEESKGSRAEVPGKKKEDGVESEEVANYRLYVSTQLWLWVPYKRRSGLPNKIPVSQKRSDRKTHHAKLVQQK